MAKFTLPVNLLLKKGNYTDLNKSENMLTVGYTDITQTLK